MPKAMTNTPACRAGNRVAGRQRGDENQIQPWRGREGETSSIEGDFARGFGRATHHDVLQRGQAPGLNKSAAVGFHGADC